VAFSLIHFAGDAVEFHLQKFVFPSQVP